MKIHALKRYPITCHRAVSVCCLLMLSFLVTACGSQPELQVQQVPAKITSQQCFITQSEGFIWLEEESEWLELPERARQQLSQADINWGLDNVFIVSAGQKSSAGYRVELTNWLLEESHWQVTRINHQPSAGSLQAQMISSPCVLIKIPKTVKSFSVINPQGQALGRWPY